MAKKEKPIDRLMDAMDRCAIARGEALWTLGYRSGSGWGMSLDESRRIERENDAEWDKYFAAQRRFHRLALSVLREARREGTAKRRAR